MTSLSEYARTVDIVHGMLDAAYTEHVTPLRAERSPGARSQTRASALALSGGRDCERRLERIDRLRRSAAERTRCGDEIAGAGAVARVPRKHLAETNHLALGMTGSTEVITVQADPDRLAQVVANLVDNALKYARTSVVVGASRSGNEAVLVVDDDGPGIATEDLPHVFERLYVSRHEPVRRETGSGLGLAIVRELVEAMGGNVAAQRAPSGGARMMVRLPTA